MKIENPARIIRHLWEFRNLIWLMSRRELQSSYKGSLLGFGWAVFHPLLMLGVYTFVFTVIFNGRWENGDGDGSRTAFALVLFLGLITFQIFSEMLNSSAQLIVSNSVYVKKVLFPLEILPVVRLVRIFSDALISMIVLAVGIVAFRQHVYASAILLPVVWLPLIILSLATGYILSALGVFIKDVANFAGILTTLLFFASAIFYPIDKVPEPYQIVFRMNPIAVFVEVSRKAVFWGELPGWIFYFSWLGVSVLLLALGYSFFMASKRAFADVI